MKTGDSSLFNKIRRLVALEIAFVGYKLIFAEYAAAVVLALALGVLLLFRAHSLWQLAAGVYLACLGINYLPMLIYTIAVGSRQNAQAEVANETAEAGRQSITSRYRWVSLLLLVPLVVPVVAVVHELSKSGGVGRGPR